MKLPTTWSLDSIWKWKWAVFKKDSPRHPKQKTYKCALKGTHVNIVSKSKKKTKPKKLEPQREISLSINQVMPVAS